MDLAFSTSSSNATIPMNLETCEKKFGVDRSVASFIIPLGDSTEKVIEAIEDNGGVVVCYENCSGAKDESLLVDEEKDPVDALTERYLRTACACMSPNDNRIEYLDYLIDEYKVEGVVEVILQACHTYNVESDRIKTFVKNNKKMPYLKIETDYSKRDLGQLKTRVEAFIEML
ncbi:cation:dicarboxylase symporter family transporter [Clostridium sporogenes]|nr:cation:dicarboxylase symporter family transporter [Clostridium sporogenes]NFS24726.1 cation:dicarboxylase symporter family transporter [Clostridium sporogenes]